MGRRTGVKLESVRQIPRVNVFVVLAVTVLGYIPPNFIIVFDAIIL
jgi:hypothetical protein